MTDGKEVLNWQSSYVNIYQVTIWADAQTNTTGIMYVGLLHATVYA